MINRLGSAPIVPQNGSASPVLVVIGLGTLMSALSGSRINLVLPNLSADLGMSIDLAGWIVTSYLLAVTVLLLVAGRAGNQTSRERDSIGKPG